jgi:hypothetical protein
MNVYFSTVMRAAPLDRGGELVKVDWNSKSVLHRVPIVPRDPDVVDPNPRGSTRGGRGVLTNGTHVYVASYHSLEVFDRDLRPVNRVSNRLFAGLHELDWEQDNIWAAATCIDCAVQIDKEGKLLNFWSPRSDDVTRKRFDLPPLHINPETDNRTCNVGISTTAPGHVHLNAVAMQGDRPLVLLNRFGCLVRLNPTEILVDDPALRGCHNILVQQDGKIMINDTVNRAIRVYDPDGRPLNTIELLKFPEVERIRKKLKFRELACWLNKHGRPHRLFYRLTASFAVARPLFVRGLCLTGRGTVLVGFSPATIIELDNEGKRVLDLMQYAEDPRVCIHGIRAGQ